MESPNIPGRFRPLRQSPNNLQQRSGGPRGKGLGSELVTWLDNELISRGVRAWFGNVTEDREVEPLREFYIRHGFKIRPGTRGCRHSSGRTWVRHTESPTFHFYTRP
jgi:hypothetical protein